MTLELTPVETEELRHALESYLGDLHGLLARTQR